ncbi:MAG: hypothetical protein ACFFED_16225 [Candidatus Thorarchaeota archaeon]
MRSVGSAVKGDVLIIDRMMSMSRTDEGDFMECESSVFRDKRRQFSAMKP